uniref:Uncharacterized protein n=1 Tax=Parascaris equorum TaxID=6256 RepID=A0A914RUX2_PAREQ
MVKLIELILLKIANSDECPPIRELDMIADDKHCYAPFKNWPDKRKFLSIQVLHSICLFSHDEFHDTKTYTTIEQRLKRRDKKRERMALSLRPPLTEYMKNCMFRKTSEKKCMQTWIGFSDNTLLAIIGRLSGTAGDCTLWTTPAALPFRGHDTRIFSFHPGQSTDP